mgnify:CR=1 FL=1
MAQIKDSSHWMNCQLFFTPPDVELREILEIAAEIYNANPEIEAAILSDQQDAALAKRELRDADEAWRRTREREAAPTLFQLPNKQKSSRRALGTGCPRMPAVLVFVLLLCRGRWGSVTDQPAQERLQDSKTLDVFLHAHDIRLPARSTIHENINVVSEETLNLILTAEMRLACDEGLDDFSRYFLDSTGVTANSRWPTDSGSLSRALHRAFHYGQKLGLFGLPTFRKFTMPRELRRIRRLDYKINTKAGKPHSQEEVEKLYGELMEVGDQLMYKLRSELEWVRTQYEPEQLPPSTRIQCEAVLKQIAGDCLDADILICNIDDRVFENEKLKDWQRIPSLSDRSAAFICKGDRVPIVGYRPQLVRSGNGLVVHLNTPEGNAADSGQLVDCIDAAVRRTDCGPNEVSVDDGYCSAAGREALQELGIDVVSISGSKGKRLTPPSEWESPKYKKSRNDRSAVESLMFSLKDTVDFGYVRRRGIAAVRCELLEKVIAYNLAKLVVLRKRKENQLNKAA